MRPFLCLLLALVSLDAAERSPVTVYLLGGQSNMQGHAKISTFEHIGMDRATQPMLQEMLGADGKPIYDANGKFLKGPGYRKPEPKIKALLERG